MMHEAVLDAYDRVLHVSPSMGEVAAKRPEWVDPPSMQNSLTRQFC